MRAQWKGKESPKGYRNVNNTSHLKCPLGLSHLPKEKLGHRRSSWNNPLGTGELKAVAFDATMVGSHSWYLWISVHLCLHYFASC